MKKILFSVAILAVAASCSTNEVTDVATSSQNEIGFATLNNLTKAANDDSEQYQVYAVKAGTTDAWYIDDNSLATSDAALTYTYYWPADGTNVTFYAYAPYDAATVTEEAAAKVSIEYTVPDTADEDFTIADAVTANSSTVPFKFAHMLSKATVMIAAGTNLNGYTLDLSGVTIDLGVFGTTATYDVMSAASGAVTTTLPATTPTALTTYTKDYSITTSATTTCVGYVTTYNSFLFMPQTAAGCTITVKGLKITDPNGNVILDSTNQLASYVITADDLTAFVAGTQYQITLTVDENSIDKDGDDIFGSAIEFSADITEYVWETDNTVTLDYDVQVADEDSSL